jgi:hypothetical protein
MFINFVVPVDGDNVYLGVADQWLPTCPGYILHKLSFLEDDSYAQEAWTKPRLGLSARQRWTLGSPGDHPREPLHEVFLFST